MQSLMAFKEDSVKDAGEKRTDLSVAFWIGTSACMLMYPYCVHPVRPKASLARVPLLDPDVHLHVCVPISLCVYIC